MCAKKEGGCVFLIGNKDLGGGCVLFFRTYMQYKFAGGRIVRENWEGSISIVHRLHRIEQEDMGKEIQVLYKYIYVGNSYIVTLTVSSFHVKKKTARIKLTNGNIS